MIFSPYSKETMSPDLVIKILQASEDRLSGEEKRVLLAVVAKMEVENHGQLTGKEIGKIVDMTQPSVSATLTALVERGFLTKENAPRGNLRVYGPGKKLLPYMSNPDDE